MSEEDKSSKTEKPTPKKLREAREKGDVPKSKDLSSTVGTLVWLLIMIGASSFWSEHLGAIVNRNIEAIQKPFDEVKYGILQDAVRVFLLLGVLPLVVSSLLGILIEFLQVRGVVAFSKVKPDVKHLNPVKGIERIFNWDNAIELIKSVLKTVFLVAILIMILRSEMDSIVKIPYSSPEAVGAFWWNVSMKFTVWVVLIFFFVSAVDVVVQHKRHIEKLRMSRRELVKEFKDDEGDPYVRQRRKQLHQEWADQNMLSGVRRSNVVVTNPTHYAVALRYEKGETDVPIVVAKGEDHMARMIRETALREGIPIMENVSLARALHAEVEIDDYIPSDLFEAVAQVLLWAQRIKAEELDCASGAG